jgi:hypothetical protein
MHHFNYLFDYHSIFINIDKSNFWINMKLSTQVSNTLNKTKNQPKNVKTDNVVGATLQAPVSQLFKISNPISDENENLTQPNSLTSSPLFPPLAQSINTNKTGLPNHLKSGIEQLSGISLEDVKVHYNSKEPASLKAHAYAQGKDIHVAAGQEKHLPHEAWHVVQQKQGRVKPTLQKNNVNINDNEALESEATQMGEKALQNITISKNSLTNTSANVSTAQLQGDEIQRIEGDETQLKEPKKLSLFQKFKNYVKSERIASGQKLASIGINTAALAHTANTASKISGIGGGVLGGITALKGGADIISGGIQSNNANNFLNENKKDIHNEEITKARVNASISKIDGDDRMSQGAFGLVSGGLSTAGGIATATGIGAPIGIGLGVAGIAVSGAGMIHKMAIQSGRDKEARRVRSKEEIGADKIAKNKERESRINGSNFNPLNWGAKISRLTGLFDSDDKKITNKNTPESEKQLNDYIEKKRGKYGKEGYDYEKFDGKENQSTREISKKTTKQVGGSRNPFKWGEGSKTETTEKKMDHEDIMIKKALHSKEVNERKEKELAKKSWWSW